MLLGLGLHNYKDLSSVVSHQSPLTTNHAATISVTGDDDSGRRPHPMTEEEGILILLRLYHLRRVLPLREPFDRDMHYSSCVH